MMLTVLIVWAVLAPVVGFVVGWVLRDLAGLVARLDSDDDLDLPDPVTSRYRSRLVADELARSRRIE